MKGILMTPANHLATRKRIKTMTRRLDGLKEINKEPDKWHVADFYQATGGNNKWWAWFSKDGEGGKPYTIIPRYQPNETVYLKEVWYAYGRWVREFDKWWFEQLKDEIRYSDNTPSYMPDGFSRKVHATDWHKRSPLFLSEENARDFIKITKVGIGRLQDITEEEAKAESAEALYKTAPNTFGAGYIWTPHGYRDGFIKLWNSINGKTYPWKLNP
ncbi:MAG: hypothetical protein PHQ86_07670, partial [Dehalococcoidales bacterium]|nr:hypothetical protein [Dehalococcoidales bacterium]